MAINNIYLSLFIMACVAVTTSMGNASTNRDITYEDVLQMINDPKVFLVDVRRPAETAETGVIPSATNIPLADLRDALNNTSSEAFLDQYHRDKPNSDSQIIVYCRSGARAQEALEIALELGYVNTKRYPGSWLEWSEKQKLETAQHRN